MEPRPEPCRLHPRRQAGCPICRAYARWHRAASKAGLINPVRDLRHLRAHLHAVAACSGVGYIADTALVPTAAVERYMGLAGPTPTRIDQRRLRDLLAVDVPAPHALIPSAGFLRRLDDLSLRGFASAAVAGAIGVRPSTLTAWVALARGGRRVHAYRVARLTAGWVLLDGRHGGNAGAARKARARGAVPAQVWGRHIDDPAAVPQVAAPTPQFALR